MSDRYKAFISYSHQDKDWAVWLQNALERFHPPNDLKGSDGETANRLRPIFRDNTELASSEDLGSAVTQAMERSDALILICSPNAAASRWVNEEVRLFRKLAPNRRVLCMMVGGSPDPDSPDCAFPKAILRDDTGNLLPEPLAADARKDADGKRGALLKIAAGLLGVGVDALRQREQQRRIRVLSGIAAITSVVAVVTIILAITAMRARDEAELRRTQAENLIEFMLVELRGKLEPIGRLDLLDAVGGEATDYFTALGELGSDEELFKRVLSLRQIGEVRFAQRDFEPAFAAFDQSRSLANALVERDRADNQALFELSQAEFWVGYVAWQQGNLDGADTAFQKYYDLSKMLFTREPENPDYKLEMTYALSNLASLARARGDADAALVYIQDANALNAELLAADPADDYLRAELAQGYSWEGSILSDRGELAASEAAFRRTVEAYQRLHEAQLDKRHSASLAASLDLLANNLLNQGRLDASLETQEACAREAEALVLHDPQNAQWARILTGCLIRSAETSFLSGDVTAARAWLARLEQVNDSLVSGTTTGQGAALQRNALIMNARMLLNEGAAKEALLSAEQALELSRESGGDAAQLQAGVPVELVQALTLTGQCHSELGDPQPAQALWLESKAVLLDVNVRTPVALALLARAHHYLGDSAKRDELMRQLEAKGFQDPRYLPTIAQ